MLILSFFCNTTNNEADKSVIRQYNFLTFTNRRLYNSICLGSHWLHIVIWTIAIAVPPSLRAKGTVKRAAPIIRTRLSQCCNARKYKKHQDFTHACSMYITIAVWRKSIDTLYLYIKYLNSSTLSFVARHDFYSNNGISTLYQFGVYLDSVPHVCKSK